ncbi:MAG: HD domain-containing protein [Candidatus Gracilibacteria bacterium]
MNGFKFEQAIRLLVKFYPEQDQKKPSLFHSIRVGSYLYNNGYSEEIQIAGLLHDALEDTIISEDTIKKFFGENILKIVIANSKSDNIKKEEVLENIILKCVEYGENALIVKMIDVYDNFIFYINEQFFSEIDRCKYLAELIIKHKPQPWNDKSFKLVNEILKYKIEK